MNAASDTPSARGPKAFQVIFLGGLIAGTLDITAACVVAWLRAGVSPVRVLQSVASGLLGAASSTGGPKTAVLGLALHFLIATVATAGFYFASRKLRFMVARPVTIGLLYGVAVYLFMNFIVLPLSAVLVEARRHFLDALLDCSSLCSALGCPFRSSLAGAREKIS